MTQLLELIKSMFQERYASEIKALTQRIAKQDAELTMVWGEVKKNCLSQELQCRLFFAKALAGFEYQAK